jgi:hypothetical protein
MRCVRRKLWIGSGARIVYSNEVYVCIFGGLRILTRVFLPCCCEANETAADQGNQWNVELLMIQRIVGPFLITVETE